MSLCGAMGAGSRARGLFCHNAERLGFVLSLCVEATAGEPGGAPVLDGLGPSELRSRAWARDATLQSRGGGGRGHRHGRRREAPGIGVSGDHDPKAPGGLGMGRARSSPRSVSLFLLVVGSEASLDADGFPVVLEVLSLEAIQVNPARCRVKRGCSAEEVAGCGVLPFRFRFAPRVNFVRIPPPRPAPRSRLSPRSRCELGPFFLEATSSTWSFTSSTGTATETTSTATTTSATVSATSSLTLTATSSTSSSITKTQSTATSFTSTSSTSSSSTTTASSATTETTTQSTVSTTSATTSRTITWTATSTRSTATHTTRTLTSSWTATATEPAVSTCARQHFVWFQLICCFWPCQDRDAVGHRLYLTRNHVREHCSARKCGSGPRWRALRLSPQPLRAPLQLLSPQARQKP